SCAERLYRSRPLHRSTDDRQYEGRRPERVPGGEFLYAGAQCVVLRSVQGRVSPAPAVVSGGIEVTTRIIIGVMGGAEHARDEDVALAERLGELMPRGRWAPVTGGPSAGVTAGT